VNQAAAESPTPVRFLLDEHYPPVSAERLRTSGVDAVALVLDRAELKAASDAAVLRAAVNEGRVVVTEDVNSFAVAIAQVRNHVGVVYCRSRVFPRTPAGIAKIEKALKALAADPPPLLGTAPVIVWLAEA
jgi:hypothetical protein